MELGRYAEAANILARPQQRDPNPTWMSIRARYDELTGNLSGARVEMAAATQIVDRMISVPAYARSWYHMRDAQLAFEAGDSSAASRRSSTKRCASIPTTRWRCSFRQSFIERSATGRAPSRSAQRSAELYPLPQALGYEADAQRALGDAEERSGPTRSIRAEQRLFNAQGINDRLLAIYYAEHDEHLSDALAAARSDIAKRGNEIYADDTMAWVLARDGPVDAGARLRRNAPRDTARKIPSSQYHAGIIALHTGHRRRSAPPAEASAARPTRTSIRSTPTTRAACSLARNLTMASRLMRWATRRPAIRSSPLRAR